MKVKKEFDSTTNRSVYNKLYKRWMDHIGKIKCDRCSYHKNENGESKSRTWKRHRKTQYIERTYEMDLQEKIKNLEQAIAELEKSNEELNQHLCDQSDELTELEKKNSELQDENQTLTERLAELESHFDDISSSIGSIDRSLSAVRKVF